MMVNAPMMGDPNPQPQEDMENKKDGCHPDPKEIGREFVRQYYTMLAEHPKVLYRFYSNDSVFIHCESNAEVGQSNIQKKIQQLKFENCRAKIKKVDACGSKGGGVVIQVIGVLFFEDGETVSRRFMQTFYLAQQTQKNYYVHNDIFHYVDDVFKDDEMQIAPHEKIQERPESREQEMMGQPLPQRVPPNNGAHNSSHSTSSAHGLPPAHYSNGAAHPEELSMSHPSRNNSESYVSVPPHHPQPPRSHHTSSGPVKAEVDEAPEAQAPLVHPSSSIPPKMEGTAQSQAPVSHQRTSESVPSSSGPQESTEQVESNEPKSWAERARGKPQPAQFASSAVGMGTPGMGAVPVGYTPQHPPPNMTMSMDQSPTFGDQSGVPPHHGTQGGQPPQQFAPPRSRPSPRFEEKRELFVGNVPQDFTKDDLRHAFESTGHTGIMDVKLVPSREQPPRTIAFVEFQSHELLQKSLDILKPGPNGKRSISMPWNGGTALMSVEEKKDREGMGGMGGRGRGGQYGGGPNNRVYSNNSRPPMNRTGNQGPNIGGPGGPRTGQGRGGMEGGRGQRRAQGGGGRNYNPNGGGPARS